MDQRREQLHREWWEAGQREARESKISPEIWLLAALSPIYIGLVIPAIVHFVQAIMR